MKSGQAVVDFVRVRRRRAFAVLVVGTAACGIVAARADVAFEPSWAPPAQAVVADELRGYLDRAEASAEVRQAAQKAWDRPVDAAPGEEAILDRLMAAMAEVDPRVAELKTQWGGPFAPGDATWLAWLSDSKTDPFVARNVRLAHGRWLAQQGLFDEAVRELGDLRPEEVVDPAALLFYRMAAQHQLVHPDESRNDLVQLLERESSLPRRFQQLAVLVERDLAALKDDSLDHISRRMNDVERRLELGHAGPRIQEVERGVLDALDKMIKDAEDEAKKNQSGGGGAAGGSGKGGATPMQDSMPGELKAPGRVDQKPIGQTAGWGDLPPKERERALQQIGRDFPAQYREAIEQYFRELATESASHEP